MTDSEEEQSNLKKSSSFPKKWINLYFLTGLIVGLVVGLFVGRKWLVQWWPPTVRHVTDKEYPSLQECPKVEDEEVEMKFVSWNAKSKKCIYKYKYKYRIKVNENEDDIKTENNED
jgi:hypothetical protein